MKLILVRKTFLKDRTLGELYIEGRYKVKVGWSPKAGKNVPWLQKVPHFNGIQIHVGNFPKDTRGCILVGAAEKNVLIDSKLVFYSLMNKLKFEKDIEIEVVREAHEAHPQPLPGEGSALAPEGCLDSVLEKFL